MVMDDLPYAYTDPEDLLHYPFSFNNTYTDTWATSFGGGGDTWYRKGKTTVTADGYGTLITPVSTYNNVMRVHFVQIYSDSIDLCGFPYKITYNNDEYFWYKDGCPTPIAAIYNLTSSGSNPVKGSVYLSTPLGTNDLNDIITSYNVSPNPAIDKMNLGFTLRENKKVEIKIFNALGENVQNSQIEQGLQGDNAIQLDITQLPGGVYFAQYVIDNNVNQTQKFIVSK
jgi:hypothetical protein